MIASRQQINSNSESIQVSSAVLDSLIFEVSQGWRVSANEATNLVKATLTKIAKKGVDRQALIREIRLETLEDLAMPDRPRSGNIPDLSRFSIGRSHVSSGDILLAKGLSFEYGARKIINNASFTLSVGRKLGIVGRNGSGKSTLVKMILGHMTPSRGTIDLNRRAKTFYLPQVATEIVNRNTLVIEEIKRSPADLAAVRDELEQVEQAQARNAKEAITLASREAELRARYCSLNGIEFEVKYHSLLRAFGFGAESLYRPLSQLSGGELTKLFLARAVLESPDLLLLDEPTNNLDLLGIAWLRAFLSKWPYGFICISHERELLQESCDSILEIECGETHYYPVGYSEYRYQRQIKDQQRQNALEEKELAIEKALDIYRRLNKGTTSARARSYRDKAARLAQDLPAEQKKATMIKDFSLTIDRHVPEVLFKSHSLVIGFPGIPLLSLPERLELRRSDKVGVIGPNGIGKSTLIKTMVGEIPPLGGDLSVNQNVEIGYLNQAGVADQSNNSAIEALLQYKGASYARVRRILASLAVSPESLEIPISSMSGGEQSKVALARIIIRNPEFIILDEPTNHLDIECREALERSLDEFDGGLLVASHDRYFLRKVCNKLWVLSEGCFRLMGLEALDEID